MSYAADATELLHATRTGDREAANELFTLLYDELRRLAHHQLSRGRPGDTLNTTGLVHELYLKLMRGSKLAWEDETHFLAVAARAMRHLIVDYARRQGAEIHGGKVRFVTADPERIAADPRFAELAALGDALQQLDRLNPRLSEVIDLSYIVGYTVPEIAARLNTSERTVKRDLSKARAFLQTVLSEQPPPGG